MRMILLERARIAAKSMTTALYNGASYGTNRTDHCPRCVIGHLFTKERRTLVASTMTTHKRWTALYERKLPVPRRDIKVGHCGRVTAHAVLGLPMGRKTIAHLLRVCRKYQRRRNMAIFRDLLKQEGDRTILRNAQRVKREAARV